MMQPHGRSWVRGLASQRLEAKDVFLVGGGWPLNWGLQWEQFRWYAVWVAELRQLWLETTVKAYPLRQIRTL